MKVCIICGQEKPLDQFPTNRRMPDGHLGWCMECFVLRSLMRKPTKDEATDETTEETEAQSAEAKQSAPVLVKKTKTKLTPEERRRREAERKRKWYRANAEEIRKKRRAYSLEYYWKNREKYREYRKKWAQKNRERLLEYHRAYYAMNKGTKVKATTI